jgi:RND family efflux transporter MFP subunit
VRRALSIALLLLAACNAGSSEEETAAAPASLEAATPVRAAEVTRGTVTVHVGGPGRTQALREVHVRAPFTGQLVALDVNDGDTVRAGAEIGAIVAQNSHAEKADAARALELAQANLVRQVLRTPAGGVVLSHKANAGDFVTEGDEIASLADASSIAFVAEIAQHDLPDIHPGAAATVELASARAPLAGIVHGLLPAGAESPSVPVRIDFARPGDARVGLFGTAAIVVAEHRDALLVPAAALLRDDVSGVSRIGVIADGGVLHWVAVTSGALADDQVEVAAPGLEAGARVAVSGHVGLPEGARVRVQS